MDRGKLVKSVIITPEMWERIKAGRGEPGTCLSRFYLEVAEFDTRGEDDGIRLDPAKVVVDSKMFEKLYQMDCDSFKVANPKVPEGEVHVHFGFLYVNVGPSGSGVDMGDRVDLYEGYIENKGVDFSELNEYGASIEGVN